MLAGVTFSVSSVGSTTWGNRMQVFLTTAALLREGGREVARFVENDVI
jgi:hypothetical protein